MITQSYTFKGIPLTSVLKITNYKVIPKAENTNDIELTINRYTDSTCQYDIEQFTKTFLDVTNEDVPLDDLPLLEQKLLSEPELA